MVASCFFSMVDTSGMHRLFDRRNNFSDARESSSEGRKQGQAA
jgi:hypothetical protein